MHTKYILNKDEVITIIALLAEFKHLVMDEVKDQNVKNNILNYLYGMFDANDIAIFNNIGDIYFNTEHLELTNDK